MLFDCLLLKMKFQVKILKIVIDRLVEYNNCFGLFGEYQYVLECCVNIVCLFIVKYIIIKLVM